jgi:two-component system cell cycle response regulator
VIGRYGGDEFAALVDGLDEVDVTRLVNKLREEFGAAPQRAPQGAALKVSATAGIAVLRRDFKAFEEWVRAAEAALQAAKRQGSGRIATAATQEA